MKVGAVHICCILLLLAAVPATGQYPPPGYKEWGSENYSLDVGESVSFHVDWDQIPVRRWMLLVEGDLRISHLNVRRIRDRSLIYDHRDESRHLVAIPWGIGEGISGVLTAGVAGEYAVSIWGPPHDDYLKAYSYEVNRALEALDTGDRDRAQMHLMSALLINPGDAVAQTLMDGLTGKSSKVSIPVRIAPAEADSAALRDLAGVRARVAELRAAGELYAALDTLQQTVAPELGTVGLAQVYGDLAAVYLDLGNAVQAEAALDAARSLGLEQAVAEELNERLKSLR